MRLSVTCIMVVGMIMTAGALCYGAQVDSPSYKHWSKFKVGTTVTFKNESTVAGNSFESEMTTTLVSLDADKAVIETVMKQGGKSMPPTRLEIPAKMDQVVIPPGTHTLEVKDAKQVTMSTEEVDVLGKKVKATVTETKDTANGMNTVNKSWTSDEIPGMVIKSEMTMSGTVKATGKGTLISMTIK